MENSKDNTPTQKPGATDVPDSARRDGKNLELPRSNTIQEVIVPGGRQDITEQPPFPGPRPFTREDQSLFFGRDLEIMDLAALIQVNRAALMYAPSGAGKSSLLEAGLRPILEKEQIEIFPPARISGLLPDGITSDQINNRFTFNVLCKWSNESPKSLLRTRLVDFVKSSRHPSKDGEDLFDLRLMIFDQFEELFSLYADRPKQREEFILQLCEALDEDRLLRVLFVIREDFLARFDRYSPKFPDKLRARFHLEPLGEQAAIEAIQGPLKVKQITVQSGVAEALVKKLLLVKETDEKGTIVEIEGEFVEPVQLQVVCQDLYSRLKDGETQVTLEHIKKLDVNKPLLRFFEAAVRKAAEKTRFPEEKLREFINSRLITPLGTRGMVAKGVTTTEGIPNETIKELEDLHLIRSEHRSGAVWLELTHDRLIDPIQQSVSRFATLKEYDGAIHRNPDDVWGYVNKGLFLGRLGEYDEALDTFAEAVRIAPLNPDVYMKRGIFKSDHGYSEEAIADFDMCLRLAPGNEEALRRKVEELQKNGLQEKTREVLNETLKSDPGNIWAYSTRAYVHLNLYLYTEAAADFKSVIALDPHDRLTHENAVRKLFELRLLVEAESLLHAMLDVDSTHVWAHAALAATYADIGKNEASIVECDSALELDKSNQWAHATKGKVLTNMGRYPEALWDLTQAIEIDPGYAYAYQTRGFAHFQLKNYEDSITDLRKAAELDPNDKWSLKTAADALRKLQLYVDAMPLVDRALALDPSYVSAYNLKGLIYSDQNDYERAIKEFDHAIDLDPRFQWSLANKAEILRKLGRFDEALQSLQEAIDIDPHYTYAYQTRATVYREQSNHESSLADLKKAAELNSKDKWTYQVAADELRMLGRYPEAMEMVDRSLQLDPNYVDAHNVRGAIYMDKNAYASAVMEFNTAIALDKSYKWAFSNKANILQMLGRYNDALSASESAIEIDPLFRYAYKIRGLVHSGLGNYSQALDDLQRAADTNPPDTSVYLDMAKLLGKTGRVEEGLELLQKVTVEDDSSRCARASLLMKLGKREEAFQQLEVCIQNELKLIEDDAAQAGNHYGTAAWYWYLQEQYEKSIEAGRKALEYDDASATVNLNLGLSFIATGKFDAAKQAYAAAIAKLDEMGTSSAEEGIDDLDMLLEKRPELSKPIAEARQSLQKLLKELLAMPIRDESRAAAV